MKHTWYIDITTTQSKTFAVDAKTLDEAKGLVFLHYIKGDIDMTNAPPEQRNFYIEKSEASDEIEGILARDADDPILDSIEYLPIERGAK